jgi:hypothetical protein
MTSSESSSGSEGGMEDDDEDVRYMPGYKPPKASELISDSSSDSSEDSSDSVVVSEQFTSVDSGSRTAACPAPRNGVWKEDQWVYVAYMEPWKNVTRKVWHIGQIYRRADRASDREGYECFRVQFLPDDTQPFFKVWPFGGPDGADEWMWSGSMGNEDGSNAEEVRAAEEKANEEARKLQYQYEQAALRAVRRAVPRKRAKE